MPAEKCFRKPQLEYVRKGERVRGQLIQLYTRLSYQGASLNKQFELRACKDMQNHEL